MHIGNIEVTNPVFLAPMAGVTDWAYRTICAELGAGVGGWGRVGIGYRFNAKVKR